MASSEAWRVQMRKGLLELCVLNALGGGERYGYELVKSLTDLPGLGVGEGTLYPLLSRLRLQGLVSTRLVESSEGPARKYYALTDEGREAATVMNELFGELVDGWQRLRRQGARRER